MVQLFDFAFSSLGQFEPLPLENVYPLRASVGERNWGRRPLGAGFRGAAKSPLGAGVEGHARPAQIETATVLGAEIGRLRRLTKREGGPRAVGQDLCRRILLLRAPGTLATQILHPSL